MNQFHQKRAVLGVCVAAAIGGLVFSELTLTLASIKTQLHATLNQLQWIMNIYGILVCSTLVVFGRLGDVIGRKKLFLIALVLLALSMTLMGIAPNIYFAIGSQALNGLSSAIIMPVSQALVTNMYPEEKRSKAIGLCAASGGIALALGPVYSGVIVHLLSWRWVFLLNVPMIVLSFIFVLYYAKESKSNEQAPQIDWLGAVFLCSGMASFVMMIVQSQLWSHSAIALLAIVSVLSFSMLFSIEMSVKQPIIREDLFKNRGFLLASFCVCILVFFIWADFFLLPLFLQTVLGYKPLYVGYIMLFVTIPLVLFSMRSQWFYQSFGPKRLIVCGMVFLIISAGLQCFFKENVSLLVIILAAFSFGIAWSFIWNPAATRAVSTLSLSHAGIAAGTFVTFQEIGGGVGLAVTGAVVGLYPSLEQGYVHGMLVLFMVSVIGLITALFMHRDRPHHET